MAKKIVVAGIQVTVTRKKIKNVHLSVYPPNGVVRMSVPLRMSDETLRVFLVAKVRWIRSQQKKLQEAQRETPREFIDRESHYLWGSRLLLKVKEEVLPPNVEVKSRQLILRIRPGSTLESRESVVHAWYRDQVRIAADPVVAKWEKKLNVRVNGLFVQKMKTKWGSCNTTKKNIRLNTELGKKPKECLEYIVVHELVHLLEPSHNAKFQELMDTHLPNWRALRSQLNTSPLAHADWKY
jgi:predicted metal-dependent hydrolase